MRTTSAPDLPDLAGFPRDRWLRSLRSAWRESGLEAIGSADPRGVPELREALADYLAPRPWDRRRARAPTHLHGLSPSPVADLPVAEGHGIESVALEEPGWHPQRLIIEEAGLGYPDPRRCRRHRRRRAARTAGADAVVVTPAHQFPTGVVLSPRRRAALIEWAERGDRLIIEDDYDGELCGERVGALQGLAPTVSSTSARRASG